MARIWRRLAQGVWMGLGLVQGCVLLVSPPEGDEECRLGNSNTLCGNCIIEQCQEAVNDCCADSRCRELLTQIEDCARNTNESCEAFKELSFGQATGSALSKCVQSKCPGRCEAVGTSGTYCTDMLTSNQTACSCRYGEASNELVCSPLEYPDTLCCAPAGWPSVGQNCTCQPIGCEPSPDGCVCLLVDYSHSVLSRACEGLYCCAFEDACRCGSTPCKSWETPVERCSLDALTCPTQQTQVATCSIHE